MQSLEPLPTHRAAHGLDPWASLSTAQAASGPRVKPVDSPVIDWRTAQLSCCSNDAPHHRTTKYPRTPPEGDNISAGPRPLARGALGENALQGAAVHIEAACRFRDIAIAQFVDPL